MGLSNISPVNQQRIAVLTPLIALVLSLFVVYPAWGRYVDKRATIEKKRIELEKLKATPVPAPPAFMPTADDLPTEPPQFEGQISAVAAASQCELANFDLSAPTGGTSDADKESPVKALRARVEINADYPHIRSFIYNLGRAPRLFVVTSLDITTNTSGKGAPVQVYSGPLHASMEIERYVAPSATAAVNRAQ